MNAIEDTTNAMDDRDKRIEELGNDLKNSRACWIRYSEEADALKEELSMYKNLCKAQSEIINSKLKK